MEFKKAIPRTITIEPTANGGFIVTAGCCTLCFGNTARMVEAMDEYLSDPEGHEKRYNEMQTAESITTDQLQTSIAGGTLDPRQLGPQHTDPA